MKRAAIIAAVVLATTLSTSARAGYDQTFEADSLIIPMDLAYQDHGMFQAYGLVFQLLRQGITVYWVIDPDKVWHDADCDTAGDECAWDCTEEGSGDKCPYPTASPDFYASAEVVWDDSGVLNAGDPIADHGYRGGPFVVASADASAAMAIIDAWNDPALWAGNPWAERTESEVVTVHRATASFDGHVLKEMIAAPTIAVFSDGNEDIATSYLRAAGIPQSNGTEFPNAKCGADDCGPGTANPDMLTVESIMGDMGTCDATNVDHKNGALFTPDGIPAYCQIMSMHWNVNDREKVECDGGGCPNTEAECNGETFTYHGHEVVAEVRQFLQYPTHFFAECQAVNAYENTVPNPAWPFLDDPDRKGHFLTTVGTPPPCPCTDPDYSCVTGGCNGGTQDCCIPTNDKEKGAGFMIAAQPSANTILIRHPGVAYNQLDGAFATVGGSEPAYNLAEYMDATYINQMDVTFITAPPGPGNQDVWMTGYMEGECNIIDDDVQPPGTCTLGKISYLGGHSYSTHLPLSGNFNSQGCRLFLNALFEADCVTTTGAPNLQIYWTDVPTIVAQELPVSGRFTVNYANQGAGTALDAVLTVAPPPDSTTDDYETGGTETGGDVRWDVGSIGKAGGQAGDPPSNGSRWIDLSFGDWGEYELDAVMEYRVGVSVTQAGPTTLTVRVLLDSDGDTIPDELDPDPDDPYACGDTDDDGCDDCSVNGAPTPADDGPDSDGDGICDASDIENPPNGTADDGCGCRQSAPGGGALMLLLLTMLWVRRRRA